MKINYQNKKMIKPLVLFFYTLVVSFSFNEKIISQNYKLVAVTSVVSGNETNNALFKVTSNIPSLSYIRAQRIKGPQDGIFTQYGDNIRYISNSSVSGIPGNLSRIRFTFLQSDRRTPIPENNFRFIINDIDGSDNEALATNCDSNLHFLGTANPTNLTVINLPPKILAIGSVNENDGPTSRVMFEFKDVSVVELDNYANDGYLKDFDMNDDYPIAKPVYVKCKSYNSSIYTEVGAKVEVKSSEFKSEENLLKVNTKSIYFNRDKYDIREDAATELKKVVNIMKKYPKLIIEVQSHTDSRAADSYNIILSHKRAKSTVEWILSKGINPSRITGKGYGETKLVNKCSNGVECSEDEHQLNRRTDFVIINPEVINQQ